MNKNLSTIIKIVFVMFFTFANAMSATVTYETNRNPIVRRDHDKTDVVYKTANKQYLPEPIDGRVKFIFPIYLDYMGYMPRYYYRHDRYHKRHRNESGYHSYYEYRHKQGDYDFTTSPLDCRQLPPLSKVCETRRPDQ